MKKLELIFYKTTPSDKNTGLKHVLWEIVGETGTAYDWGFGHWDGKEWGAIEVPEGFTAKVAFWANTVDPKILLEDKRIIV